MDKHSDHFQPRGTTTAVVSLPLVGLLHQDLSVLCLFPASALALCISSLPAGPVASASSACSQRAFQLHQAAIPLLHGWALLVLLLGTICSS